MDSGIIKANVLVSPYAGHSFVNLAPGNHAFVGFRTGQLAHNVGRLWRELSMLGIGCMARHCLADLLHVKILASLPPDRNSKLAHILTVERHYIRNQGAELANFILPHFDAPSSFWPMPRLQPCSAPQAPPACSASGPPPSEVVPSPAIQAAAMAWP